MVRRKSSPTKTPSSDSQKVNKTKTKTPKKKSGKIEVRQLETGRRCIISRKIYREIKLLQAKTNVVIPKLSFSRVVREIMMGVGGSNDFRIQSDALRALQEACEMYMTQFFEDSYYCTLHANRKTLMVKDMQLTRLLRGRQDVINH